MILMKTKFIAISISLIAILLTGCGQEKAEQKPSSLPQAAPAQQANTPLPDKVISKGKIVGTAKVVDGNTVQVEEREIETYGIGDKRVVEKRYYEAGTDNFLPGYKAQQKYKNKKIKNEGQSLPPFKSH
jgi:endonuclease YncB( thermonuclease family)